MYYSWITRCPECAKSAEHKLLWPILNHNLVHVCLSHKLMLQFQFHYAVFWRMCFGSCFIFWIKYIKLDDLFSVLKRNLFTGSARKCCFYFVQFKDSFRELWNQIMSSRSGLELQSHRFRLRTYQNCFVGSELVDWLLTHEKTSTRCKILCIRH